MVQNIYLIRHGETDWNKCRRFQGSMDIELNEVGRQQAVFLQKAMKEIPIDRIVSSDLLRAQETAKILNQPHGLTVEVDAGFREIHFGLWEGMNFQQIEALFPEEASLWKNEPGALKIPEGETFQQLTERVWQRFLFWCQRSDYQNLAIVSHGGTCAALICAVLGEPIASMWKYVQANTAVNHVVREDDTYRLIGYNNQSHLHSAAE
jgi:alpha-ribazole phosphatase